MRKSVEKSSPSDQPLADEVALVKEYELLKPIIYRGQETKLPAKVLLDDQQAERLRETGHIQ